MSPSRKHYFFLVILFLICAFIGIASVAFFRINQTVPCKIVLVYSFSSSDKGYGHIRNNVISRLKELGLTPDVREIYLNSGHITPQQSDAILIRNLSQLKKWNPDLIMVKGDQALDMVMKADNAMLRSKPVIFHGVHFLNLDSIHKHPNFSGYWDKPEYWKNMLLIKQLLGKVTIDINYSKSPIGLVRHKRLMEELKDKKVNLRLNPLSRSDYKDSTYWDSTMVKTCPNPEIYLNAVPIPNMNGQGFIHHFKTNSSAKRAFLIGKFEYSPHIVSGFYHLPIFTTLYEGFGEGMNIVGGYFANEQTVAIEWANLAKQAFDKKLLAKQTILMSAKQYNIDYQMIDYWDISRDLLPKDTLLYNVPFYARYGQLFSMIIWITVLGLLYAIYYLRFVRRKAVSERKRAERIQKDIDEIIHSLEQSDTLIWNISREGYIHFDSSHRLVTHLQQDDFTFDEFVQLVDDEDKGRVLYNLNHIYNTAICKMEARLLFSDTPTWYSFRYSIINNPDGSRLIYGIIENIESRKLFERELIEARKMAEDAENKQSFLENLNHEIRTPLNSIVGFSNIICNDVGGEISEETKAAYIKAINENNDILMALIRDILEISRIDSGYAPFLFEDVRVSDVLAELKMRESDGIKHELQFQVIDKNVEDVYIHVDKARLLQTFHYLVSNANKFTKQGGITVSCWLNVENKEIHMNVSDTGCGISPQRLKIIFNRFYKGDSFKQGTGLGLSICDAIVSKLSGHILVKSKINEGSTFTVVLPYTVGTFNL